MLMRVLLFVVLGFSSLLTGVFAADVDTQTTVEATLRRMVNDVSSETISARMEVLRAAAATYVPESDDSSDSGSASTDASPSPFWSVYQRESGVDDANKVYAAAAFWKAYATAKLQQVALNADQPDEIPAYLNLRAMIQGVGAQPVIIRGASIDTDGEAEIAAVKSGLTDRVFARLFPYIQQLAVNEDGEITLRLIHTHPQCLQSLGWFRKVLKSKDSATDSGKRMLLGRVKALSEYLQANMPTNAAGEHNVRRLVVEYILGNSQECEDRAVSGLDDVELDIHFSSVNTLEEALQIVLQLYKRQLIVDHLVSHEFAESAEERIYLELMLNSYFNLGVCPVDISSAPCGARKTFDAAVQKIMDTLSLEGFIGYIAREPHFRRWMNANGAYADELADIIATPSEDVENDVVAYVVGKVRPRVESLFVLEADRYGEVDTTIVEEIETLFQRIEGVVEEEA